MSNAMRFGKRSLAGLASGALLLSGIAIAAAQPAQAAQTFVAICAGNSTGTNGTAGSATDPTSVKPNCSVVAGVGIGNAAPFNESAIGVAQGYTWYQFTVQGDSTFLAGGSPVSGQVISSDAKTIWAPEAAVNGATTSFGLQVPTAGTRTVTVSVSKTVSSTVPAANTFTDAGTFTVTGIGTATQAVVSQGYYAVSQFNATADDSAALAIVHVVDSSGAVVNLAGSSVSNLNYTASGGTISTGLYGNGDCDATTGVLRSIYDPGNLDAGSSAAQDYITDACEITVGAGVATTNNSGLWVFWDAAASTGSQAGSYTATFTLTTASGASFPVSVNYVVSSPVAAAWTWNLDKANYLPGGVAALTVTARDVNGRIVPDGLGWDKTSPGGSGTWLRNLLTNGVETNAPIFAPTGGAAINPSAAFKVTSGTQATISTYNGETAAAFLMPAASMEAFVIAGENTTDNGWAVVAQETTKAATAKIGNPEPVKPTIMIVGERGKGDNLNMVFVEGTTTELAGQTVTPYFRFPGQTGFTAGTGLRTVDAQGNFAWQRKTGKQIAVQFRAGDVKSNTTIIEAK